MKEGKRELYLATYMKKVFLKWEMKVEPLHDRNKESRLSQDSQ